MGSRVCSLRALRFVFGALLFSFCLGLNSRAEDVADKRKELSQIRSELERSQRRVDSLRGEESGVTLSLSRLDKRLAKDEKEITLLTNRLRSLKGELRESEARVGAHRDAYTRRTGKFLDDVADMYMHSAAPLPSLWALSDPNQEADLEWRSLYLADIGSWGRHVVEASRDSALSAELSFDKAQKAQLEVKRLRTRRQKSVTAGRSQKEKSLETLATVRQIRESESDRLLYLSESAKQMADLIARLESSQKAPAAKGKGARAAKRGATGRFVALKGQMDPPIRGQVQSPFGWKQDPVTKLKSFSPGVEIQGAAGFTVRAIADGAVVYVGVMRGYQNFVIVNHDDGYYSTYGGMSSVTVALDQTLTARDAIGVTADGRVRFELRRGQEAVDPARWLDYTGR